MTFWFYVLQFERVSALQNYTGVLGSRKVARYIKYKPIYFTEKVSDKQSHSHTHWSVILDITHLGVAGLLEQYEWSSYHIHILRTTLVHHRSEVPHNLYNEVAACILYNKVLHREHPNNPDIPDLLLCIIQYTLIL